MFSKWTGPTPQVGGTITIAEEPGHEDSPPKDEDEKQSESDKKQGGVSKEEEEEVPGGSVKMPKTGSWVMVEQFPLADKKETPSKPSTTSPKATKSALSKSPVGGSPHVTASPKATKSTPSKSPIGGTLHNSLTANPEAASPADKELVSGQSPAAVRQAWAINEKVEGTPTSVASGGDGKVASEDMMVEDIEITQALSPSQSGPTSSMEVPSEEIFSTPAAVQQVSILNVLNTLQNTIIIM